MGLELLDCSSKASGVLPNPVGCVKLPRLAMKSGYRTEMDSHGTAYA